jgi:hypothetical protein
VELKAASAVDHEERFYLRNPSNEVFRARDIFCVALFPMLSVAQNAQCTVSTIAA